MFFWQSENAGRQPIPPVPNWIDPLQKEIAQKRRVSPGVLELRFEQIGFAGVHSLTVMVDDDWHMQKSHDHMKSEEASCRRWFGFLVRFCCF